MSRVVTTPPATGLRADGNLPGGWWHDDPEHGRIVCDLCPRECHLKDGDRGFCFVRQNVGGEMLLTTYGRSTGFCIDPIEKKPLNHFYPGTSVLSFGTAGCNLGCKFCQNWDISKSREVERLSELAWPEAIAEAARHFDCRSVAYTYNDPVIWAEYAIDAARACRAVGVKNVAVTAGYISEVARAAFYEYMDAANVDLKGFTEEFYYKVTYSHLQPVLDTLAWLHHETDVWLEITNLIIPQTNDSMDDIRRMCDWILAACGDETPVHFTAFHPDFRMRDLPNTPHATLLEAYELARRVGLKHVYTGNVDDVAHQSTYCPHCRALLIERNWYALGAYQLTGGNGDRCGKCGGAVAGRFDKSPGSWGRRRLPVQISGFNRTAVPGVSQAGVTQIAVSPSGATSNTLKNSPANAPKLTSITPPNAAGASSPAASQNSPHTSSAEVRMNSPSHPASTHSDAHGGGSSARPDRPQLTDAQKAIIQNAANEFVAAAVEGRKPQIADATLGGAANFTVMGAFVTLKRQGRLRACCGVLGQPMRLYEALQNSSYRTAKEDYRLPPIVAEELPNLTLDVNLLYGFEPLPREAAKRLAGVELGKHGLQIRRGENAGLFLPIVPVENNWDVETYLRQVCRKANLPTTAWEDPATQLQTFETSEFGGPFDKSVLSRPSDPPLMFSSQELSKLAEHAQANVRALTSGATPNYYLFGVSDGTVAGIALTVQLPGADPLQLTQLAIRPGVPLQATLFQLSEAAANTIRSSGREALRAAGAVRVGVTLLYDPQMHGSVAEPDLRGLSPSRHVLVVMEQGRVAWAYDPRRSSDELFEVARSQLQILSPEQATLLSLVAQSTEPSVVFSTVPRAQASAGARRPAVAGTFYPGDAGELDAMVGGLLGASSRQPESWPAAMVPHAGLIYSGKLAAAVMNRLEFPELIIVIGPKHTRLGVEWAVAPQDEWAIPGGKVASDPALARELAVSIPGLQLDAAAHQQEHAIEVELPLLARLAPRSRVVGVAIGGGGWEQCERFADGLARLLGRLPVRPLLLISSDMNHFANDRENRRLDRLALDAMQTLDPHRLLNVVREHNISMCGVLPAVIVMETLRKLGGLQTYEEVGYATSADVSGDTRRVVGYAGVLLK